MSRKHLILALVLAAALVLAGVCAFAAEEDPIKVSMELGSSTFSAPKTITVSISVTNVGDEELPGPVTLWYPSGKQVDDFGEPVLEVGKTKTWKGEWKVTQSELEAGRVSFKVKYSYYNENHELLYKSKLFSKTVLYSGAAPEIKVERSVIPTTARQGQEVSVTYELENTGTVDVTNVVIKENSAISSKSGSIESIAVGEKATHTFTVTMGKKDLTSSATVSYKSGGKTYSQRVDSTLIKYGEVKLTADLKADKKGGAPGDTVKLTLTLTNSGKVDFTNVTVTDASLGTVFSGETVPAGEKKVLEKELTIQETRDYQFTITADNATGPVETATGRVNVIATDPTKQVILKVDAKADRTKVPEFPGNVFFTITVTNESAVEVKNISISAVNTEVNKFESIPAGESRTFTREMAPSMAGTYQFTASCRDQLSQVISFESNPIQISKGSASSGGSPEATAVPAPPTAQPTVPIPMKIDNEEIRLTQERYKQLIPVANILKIVLGALAGILTILLIIGLVRRGMNKAHSSKAQDHLIGAKYRDYNSEVKPRHRSVIDGPDPEEMKAKAASAAASPEETEETAQDHELMAETLKRLYTEPASPEAGKPAQEKSIQAEEQEWQTAEEAGEKNGSTLDQLIRSTTQNTEDAAHRRRIRS